MGIWLRIIAGVILCGVIVLGIVVLMAGSRSSRATAESSQATADAPRKVAAALEVSTLDPLSLIATFPDPNAPGTSKGVFLDSVRFDTGVYSTAAEFTGPRRDEGSLEELSKSILSRYGRGMSTWGARADRLSVNTASAGEQAIEAIQIWRNLAFLEMYEGNFAKAAPWLERALELSRAPGVPARTEPPCAPCWGSSHSATARWKTAWRVAGRRVVSSRSRAKPSTSSRRARARLSGTSRPISMSGRAT